MENYLLKIPQGYFSAISEQSLALLLQYKYAAIFAILVAEGPVATLVAGALAAPETAFFSLPALFAVVFFADILGDNIYFFLGRFAGDRVLKRIEKWKHTEEHLGANYRQQIHEYFEKYGTATILIGKISHGLGWPVIAAAGSAKMSYWKFFCISFIVGLVKSAALLALGYFYGEKYSQLVRYLGSSLSAFAIILGITLAAYFLFFKKKSSRIPQA